MQHKYVRHSTIGFVLWPKTDTLWHSHVGNLLNRAGGKIISAGFCYVAFGEVRCFGRSESLNIGGLPDDEQALAKQLGLNTQPTPPTT